MRRSPQRGGTLRVSIRSMRMGLSERAGVDASSIVTQGIVSGWRRAHHRGARNFLQNQHAIAIRKKAVLLGDGVVVGIDRKVFPGEGAHKHEQAALGEVEVRDECIDSLETIT